MLFVLQPESVAKPKDGVDRGRPKRVAYLRESLEVPLALAKGDELGVDGRLADRRLRARPDGDGCAPAVEPCDVPAQPGADVANAGLAEGLHVVPKCEVEIRDLNPEVHVGVKPQNEICEYRFRVGFAVREIGFSNPNDGESLVGLLHEQRALDPELAGGTLCPLGGGRDRKRQQSRQGQTHRKSH